MSHDPRWLREAARVLSSLLQTPEEELSEFVRERLDAREGIARPHLDDVRHILVMLSMALDQPDPERWKGIAHARRSLESWEQGMRRGEDDEEAEAPSPSAPPRDDEVEPVAAPAAVILPRAPQPAANQPSPAAASPWAPQQAPQQAPQKPTPAAAPAGPTPAARAAATPTPATGLPSDSDPLARTAAHQGPVDTRTLPFKAAAPMMPTPSSLEPHPELGLTKAATNKPKASALPFQGQAARQAATPAPASGPVASGHLSLEQYAQLCAERALWPDHADHIRRRYGLDTESEKAADRQYRTAFVGDAQLQTRFNQLFVDARRKLGG